MVKISIDLQEFSIEDQNFLMEMLPYVSVYIQDIQKEGASVTAAAEDQHAEEVRKTAEELKKMVLGGKAGKKEIRIKTIWDHTFILPRFRTSAFEELIEQKAVFKITDGVYGYSGIVLTLFRYFEAKIREFGKANFPNLREHEYPVLYPIRAYERGRYFETFPHYMMFQTVMNSDLHVLNRFSEQGTADETVFDQMKRPVNVLRHAACAPLYEILKDSRIPADEMQTYLVKGKCFRNEADHVYELARLNEFTMEEYVFAGTPEQCRAAIERAQDLWRFWAEVFSLNCRVDTANDSFFAGNYKKLKLFQLMGDSKQEFKWYIPCSDDYIACSSANYHRTHFSKPYQIRTDESALCHTACFAFGIERLIYAFLNQKGTDPGQWDERTYREVSRYAEIEEKKS